MIQIVPKNWKKRHLPDNHFPKILWSKKWPRHPYPAAKCKQATFRNVKTSKHSKQKKPPAFDRRLFNAFRIWHLAIGKVTGSCSFEPNSTTAASCLVSYITTYGRSGWRKQLRKQKRTLGINQAFFNSYAISIWERRGRERKTPRINEAWLRENPPACIFHPDSSGFGLMFWRAEPSLV